MNPDKLAILMPVFNGGEQLRSSVLSCAQAGLTPEQYEIIVVDNCSTDGAIDQMPLRDSNGATVQIHRNSANLGRIGNWNRGVEIALEQGFRYITFLFVGDSWLPNGSLPELFTLVRDQDAVIGLSPFQIADESGRTTRSSQRFYISGRESAITSPRRFLETLLESGLFPLGPLQANIYRISSDHVLRFDDGLPTRTDVDATLAFINDSHGTVALVSKPFFQWREHGGRFHMSMGTRQTIRDYMDTFHLACDRTGITVDYGRAKTRVMLNSARLIVNDAPVSQWAGLLLDLLRHSHRSPYRSSFFYLFETLWLRFGLRRRLLEFS
jgi:glycosyltransferase involved in cell wall biosynthesis